MRGYKTIIAAAAFMSAIFTCGTAQASNFGGEGTVVSFDFTGTVQYRIADQVTVTNPDGSTITVPRDTLTPLDAYDGVPSLLQPGAEVNLNFISFANAINDPACGGRLRIGTTGACAAPTITSAPALNQFRPQTSTSTSSGGEGPIAAGLDGLYIVRDPDSGEYQLELPNGEYIFGNASVPDYQYDSFTQMLTGSMVPCIVASPCNDLETGIGTANLLSFPLGIIGDFDSSIGPNGAGYDAGSAGFLDIIGSFSLPVNSPTQVPAPSGMLIFALGILAILRWVRVRTLQLPGIDPAYPNQAKA